MHENKQIYLYMYNISHAKFYTLNLLVNQKKQNIVRKHIDIITH